VLANCNSNVLTDARVSSHPSRFSPSENRSNPNLASSSSSGLRFSFRFFGALLSLRSRRRPSPFIVAPTRSKVLALTLLNEGYESLEKTATSVSRRLGAEGRHNQDVFPRFFPGRKVKFGPQRTNPTNRNGPN